MRATLTTLLNIVLLENLSRERKVGGAEEGATRIRGRTRGGVLGSHGQWRDWGLEVLLGAEGAAPVSLPALFQPDSSLAFSFLSPLWQKLWPWSCYQVPECSPSFTTSFREDPTTINSKKSSLLPAHSPYLYSVLHSRVSWSTRPSHRWANLLFITFLFIVCLHNHVSHKKEIFLATKPEISCLIFFFLTDIFLVPRAVPGTYYVLNKYLLAKWIVFSYHN